MENRHTDELCEKKKEAYYLERLRTGGHDKEHKVQVWVVPCRNCRYWMHKDGIGYCGPSVRPAEDGKSLNIMACGPDDFCMYGLSEAELQARMAEDPMPEEAQR